MIRVHAEAEKNSNNVAESNENKEKVKWKKRNLLKGFCVY